MRIHATQCAASRIDNGRDDETGPRPSVTLPAQVHGKTDVHRLCDLRLRSSQGPTSSCSMTGVGPTFDPINALGSNAGWRRYRTGCDRNRRRHRRSFGEALRERHRAPVRRTHRAHQPERPHRAGRPGSRSRAWGAGGTIRHRPRPAKRESTSDCRAIWFSTTWNSLSGGPCTCDKSHPTSISPK